MAGLKPGEEGKEYQSKILDSVLLGIYGCLNNDTISCGSIGVCMTLLEEVCHCGCGT